MLSKNAFNRLKSTLTASSLEVFDSEKKKPRQFIDDIGLTLTALTSEEGMMLTQITQPSDAYIDGIDCEGLALLPDIVQSADRNNIFRTVFGATEQMPLRALSYLIPSIKIAEKLLATNHIGPIVPKPDRSIALEFLFMNEASSQINGKDAKKCRQSSDLFSHIARAYIDKFHPTVSNIVSFVTDDGFSHKLLSHQSYDRVANKVEESLDEQTREAIVRMSRNRSTRTDAFRYATLHAFVHDGFVEGALDKNHQPNCTILTSFGAAPEKLFYAVRKATLPYIGSEFRFTPVPTVQFITKHTVPPYILMEPHDILLEQALFQPAQVRRIYADRGENGLHTVVRKELSLLVEDSGSIWELEDFLKTSSK